MTKLLKITKFQIIYCVVFAIIFYSIFLPLASWCEEVQSITITKEDIINTKPTSPYEVEFSDKDLRAVKVMEKRHFPRTYPEFSDKERLKNLEYELLGRTWEFSPQNERIKRLKIASSNTALTGMALPASISSRRTARRMRNDMVGIRKKDDVGLIDGFLRLINPQAYELLRKSDDEFFDKYGEIEY